MPNKNRNPEHTRGKWSQDQLTAALEAIKKGTSIHQALKVLKMVFPETLLKEDLNLVT